MNIKSALGKMEKMTKSFKDIGKDKIKLYVRDKAYKVVIQKCIDKGTDLSKMPEDKLEQLIAKEEKEIWNKYEKVGLVGIASYIGLEIGSI